MIFCENGRKMIQNVGKKYWVAIFGIKIWFGRVPGSTPIFWPYR